MTKKKADMRLEDRNGFINLDKPIALPSGLQLADDNCWKAVEQQEMDRVLEACYFYRIPPDGEGALLLLVKALLAERFPKGFKYVPAGKLKRKEGVPNYLIVKVAQAVREDMMFVQSEGKKPLSIRAIVDDLLKKDPLFKGYKGEAVRTAYRRWDKILKEYKPMTIEEHVRSLTRKRKSP